jgi:hypothetical protein
MALFRSPLFRMALLSAYYLVIIMGLILMYGEGDFSSTEFVYQGF